MSIITCLVLLMFAELTSGSKSMRLQAIDLFSSPPPEINYLKENVGMYRTMTIGLDVSVQPHLVGVQPEIGSAFGIQEVTSINQGTFPSYLEYFHSAVILDRYQRFSYDYYPNLISVRDTPEKMRINWEAIDLLGVRYIILPQWYTSFPQTLKGHGLELVFETASSAVYLNPGAMPRAFSIKLDRSENAEIINLPSADIPVPGDYDGDGTTEAAVYRPSTGEWFIQEQEPEKFGLPGDIPVPGDYDGDGTTDMAIFRPSVGTWYIGDQSVVSYGLPGDVPLAADYDGDGVTDIAVYRPSSGIWYIRGGQALPYGSPGFRSMISPVEIAVYRNAEVRLLGNTNRPALVVLTDNWHENWRALVNGVETPIVRVNGIFRGVWVPRGKYEVYMYYQPRSLWAGIFVTGAIIVFLIYLLVDRTRIDKVLNKSLTGLLNSAP